MLKKLLFLLFLLIIILVGFHFRPQTKPSLANPLVAPPSSVELYNNLKTAGLGVSTPPIQFGDTLISTVSGVMILFSGTKDMNTQVRALQLVLAQLKMEDRKPQEIDLRFTKVVLRY